eukprot:TRINITY_DN8839_c0_g1_i1.p1 TRINITY_DN8839_c0_g1~~TRINITY_DN8839_c0_g1_i1.p1  ORF type:complete len:565 (-),score=71.35 TRINITY_DN8839_c0_g1_i1:42-1736(-)
MYFRLGRGGGVLLVLCLALLSAARSQCLSGFDCSSDPWTLHNVPLATIADVGNFISGNISIVNSTVDMVDVSYIFQGRVELHSSTLRFKGSLVFAEVLDIKESVVEAFDEFSTLRSSSLVSMNLTTLIIPFPTLFVVDETVLAPTSVLVTMSAAQLRDMAQTVNHCLLPGISEESFYFDITARPPDDACEILSVGEPFIVSNSVCAAITVDRSFCTYIDKQTQGVLDTDFCHTSYSTCDGCLGDTTCMWCRSKSACFGSLATPEYQQHLDFCPHDWMNDVRGCPATGLQEIPINQNSTGAFWLVFVICIILILNVMLLFAVRYLIKSYLAKHPVSSGSVSGPRSRMVVDSDNVSATEGRSGYMSPISAKCIQLPNGYWQLEASYTALDGQTVIEFGTGPIIFDKEILIDGDLLVFDSLVVASHIVVTGKCRVMDTGHIEIYPGGVLDVQRDSNSSVVSSASGTPRASSAGSSASSSRKTSFQSSGGGGSRSGSEEFEMEHIQSETSADLSGARHSEDARSSVEGEGFSETDTLDDLIAEVLGSSEERAMKHSGRSVVLLRTTSK